MLGKEEVLKGFYKRGAGYYDADIETTDKNEELSASFCVKLVEPNMLVCNGIIRYHCLNNHHKEQTEVYIVEVND